MTDKILAGMAALALLIVVGTIGYNEWAQQEVSVVVNLKNNEDPFVAIRQIIPVDSTIMDIRELNRENNQYFLKVKTKRAKVNLLEWFMQSSKVENAEISNDCPE
jgi:hypothetical protein